MIQSSANTCNPSVTITQPDALKAGLTVLQRVSALLFPYCLSNTSSPTFVPTSLPGLPLNLSTYVPSAFNINLDGATLSGSNVVENNNAGSVGGGSLPAQAFLLSGTPGSATATWVLAAKDSNDNLDMVKVQFTVSNGAASVSGLASSIANPAPQVKPRYTLFCYVINQDYCICLVGNKIQYSAFLLFKKTSKLKQFQNCTKGCLDPGQCREGAEDSDLGSGRSMHLLQRHWCDQCRRFQQPRS